jgi:hypothetical protein
MSATQLTITYGTTPSTVTIPIPKADGQTAIDPSLAIRNIVLAGFVQFVDANGLQTFIPLAQISKITAA